MAIVELTTKSSSSRVNPSTDPEQKMIVIRSDDTAISRSSGSNTVEKGRTDSDFTDITISAESDDILYDNGNSGILNHRHPHHPGGYQLPNQQERDIIIREIKPFSNTISTSTTSNCRFRLCIKLSIGTLIAAALISFIIMDSTYLESTIQAFFVWVQQHPGVGIIAFVGVCYCCTLLFLPVSILSSGGGFVFANSFGIWIGVTLATTAVFIGACLGAITAFLGGRYLMRETAQSLKEKYPLLEAIDSVLTEKGVRIVILLHLCPIIPFNVLNCIGGTSSMAAWTYAWTLIAILPGTLVYVCLGATASTLTLHQGKASVWEIVSVVVGLILGTIGIITMSYYANQELRKITVQRQAAAALENELI